MRAIAALLGALLVALAAPGVALAESIEKKSELGPVSLSVTLSPAAPVIGDQLTLRLDVTAESGVELLLPDFGEALDRYPIRNFESVPPRTDESGRTVAWQQYTLEPRISGAQSIPPILLEFIDRRPGQKSAPDGEDAYELTSERIDFEVKSLLPAEAAQAAALRPRLGALDPLPPPRGPIYIGGAIAAVCVLAAAPFAVRAWLRWRRLARRRSAYDIARARLEKLLAAGGAAAPGADLDRFFDELSAIIRRYIEDRFELRAPEYTTEEFLAALGKSPSFSAEHQRLLREFLRQADLVKFAHMVPSRADIDASVARARQFLDETREDAPLIDEEVRLA